eukprot:m.13159 g.13159  ORF g.13159 m.13159 type:complete len:276 (-) comp7168_c0_seq1:2036-2863(-)
MAGRQEMCSPAKYYVGFGRGYQQKYLVAESMYLHVKASEGALHPEHSLLRSIIVRATAYKSTGIRFSHKGSTHYLEFEDAQLRDRWLALLTHQLEIFEPEETSSSPQGHKHSLPCYLQVQPQHPPQVQTQQQEQAQSPMQMPSTMESPKTSPQHQPPYTHQQYPYSYPYPSPMPYTQGPLDRLPSYNTAMSQTSSPQSTTGLSPFSSPVSASESSRPAPTTTSPLGLPPYPLTTTPPHIQAEQPDLTEQLANSLVPPPYMHESFDSVQSSQTASF